MEKQTKNIANLRKQMSAYANDTSEEARNRLQQLTVQLQEAEEGRADTEYSRHLQDQQNILDRLYQSLEDYFNDKMEDTDTILQESKKLVQDNVPAIKDILANSLSFSKTAQVAVSNSLNNILNDGINHVAQNIVNTEGDIQAVKNSVLGSTISLENYLANHDLDKQKKEDLYNWIENINTQANSFNNNLQELAKAFDAQISQAMGETDKDQRLSNVISTISPAVTTAASVMKNMGTIVTTQGAILEKYSSAAASAGVSLSEAVNDNMFKLYTAYNSGQSLVDAIKSVYKLPSNVTYNLAINLDNVTDYQSFIEECKRSKQFETLIQTMTLDTMNGQSNSLKKLNI